MDHEDDDDIARALRAVMADEYGVVPDHVITAAKGAWTWRNVDAELAELLEEDALAVRSDVSNLAFAAPGVVIDVERDDNTVSGQVTDEDGHPLDATVVVDVAGVDGVRYAIEADVDAASAFRATVPAGRSRVAVTLTDGRRIVTPWLPG